MDGRQTPWKPSQPAMKSHVNSRGRPRSLNVIRGRAVSRVVDADVRHLEQQRCAGRAPRLDQIAHHLVLSVDRDRAAACQRGEVDAVPGTGECDVDAVVTHALAPKPLAHAGLCEQVHGALLEHAGPDAFDHVFLGAALEDHRVDPLQMQQVTEHQAGRAAAYDADLGAVWNGGFGHAVFRRDCTSKEA